MVYDYWLPARDSFVKFDRTEINVKSESQDANYKQEFKSAIYIGAKLLNFRALCCVIGAYTNKMLLIVTH